MGEVVNLRLARKAKTRAARDVGAAENRRRHGRTAAERQAELLAEAQASKHLDAHLIEPSRDRDDG